MTTEVTANDKLPILLKSFEKRLGIRVVDLEKTPIPVLLAMKDAVMDQIAEEMGLHQLEVL